MLDFSLIDWLKAYYSVWTLYFWIISVTWSVGPNFLNSVRWGSTPTMVCYGCIWVSFLANLLLLYLPQASAAMALATLRVWEEDKPPTARGLVAIKAANTNVDWLAQARLTTHPSHISLARTYKKPSVISILASAGLFNSTVAHPSHCSRDRTILTKKYVCVCERLNNITLYLYFFYSDVHGNEVSTRALVIRWWCP